MIGTCSNCAMWMCNNWTESKYGEECGLCELDGMPTVSNNRCPFHIVEEELVVSLKEA